MDIWSIGWLIMISSSGSMIKVVNRLWLIGWLTKVYQKSSWLVIWKGYWLRLNSLKTLYLYRIERQNRSRIGIDKNRIERQNRSRIDINRIDLKYSLLMTWIERKKKMKNNRNNIEIIKQ